MQEATKFTTAQAFGALRRQLIEEGFTPQEAFEVVMQYIREEANTGFVLPKVPA